MSIYPPKLKSGDEIRVIAPAKSFRPAFTKKMKQQAQGRLESLGLKVSFGKYVNEIDEFDSTTVEHRLEDLHSAFADKNVKGILTVLGGTQSNQLLKHLDFVLIKNNPKILCGMSDITALASAIYHKTGLVTYSGPHFTLFKNSLTVDYTLDYFKKALFADEPITIQPSSSYSDKRSDTELLKNEGYWIINKGEAKGKIIGGNLITFNLLQGSEFMPDLSDTVLFLEDNDKENSRAFENHLQSLINQPKFNKVQGLVIGRFQKGSNITKELLTKIIHTKAELKSVPVVANVDFGHTVPMITFPIGGEVELIAKNELVIRIIKH